MVFIIAASSLHHALETLNPEERNHYKKSFLYPGPKFKSTHKKSAKNCPESAF